MSSLSHNERSAAQENLLSQTLKQAVRLLKDAAVPVPQLTAEVLLCNVLGVDKSFLYAHPEHLLAHDQREQFQAALERRCRGEPTQYITGIQEFRGLDFKVTPDVLIPRPETEHLVEKALARAQDAQIILDIGTGSGCVAVSIKKNLPSLRVVAAELSRAALRVAAENSRRLRTPLEFVQADLVEAFAADSFDMVVSNPPYVPLADLPGLQRELRSEPSLALFGGEDGLRIYEKLAVTIARILKPGGWLLLELGYRACPAVEALFGGPQWSEPAVKADLAGIDRVFAVRRI
jgi:release factor glutamine methyltransferase